MFYSNKYEYRFIANSLLFSSAIKENTNGKLVQGIGTIYISEIENWDKIKDKSHWINVILTDTANPIVAKHFAFAF